MMSVIKVPIRYVPAKLTRKDTKAQLRMLMKSKKLYKSNQYYTRKRVASYSHKPSSHLRTARQMYGVESMTPTKELATKTGCSLSALRQIVKKGEGAYYSSGSRPNQTAQSWGLARLASSLTAGKSAAVDYNIIEDGCQHNKKAYKMAKIAKRKYKYGHSSTRKHKFKY